MTASILPIRKQLVVGAPIERAFEVFTARMTTWWPETHHVGSSPFVECVVEPRAGGRWYERCEDGSECEWGKVLVWDPPRRLVLAWQLTAEFRYDPALVTEVDVSFTALAAGSTQVDFEHRGLERMGAAAEKVRGMMDGGWGAILDSFVRVAAG
ncbi:MAG: SRPBCC family protein [Kofleriaceae bacterium]